MKLLSLCFIWANIYFLAHTLDTTPFDLRYLIEVQKLFCAEADTCLSASHSTSTARSLDLPESKFVNTSVTTPHGLFLPPFTPSAFAVNESYLPVMPPASPGIRCCGECSCQMNKCDVTDSCCLDSFDKLPIGNDSKVRMTCDYPQLRPRNRAYPNLHTPNLMFRECPKVSNSNIETVHKCDNSDSYDEIYTKLPVTDVTTMYIYKNRYCAYCHNVTEAGLHYWDAKLQCRDGMLQPRSISSVITEILESERCNLEYVSPESLGPDGPHYYCLMVISECNVTGHWKIYDPVIEAACLAYSTIYNYEYRNVFCYLCNTDDTSGRTRCPGPSNPPVIVDFKALLKLPSEDITVPESKVPSACSLDQIYDPLKDICRNVECLFPKTIKNGRCVNLVESLGGVTYGIFLKLSPLEAINISERFYSNHFAEDIKEVIISWLNAKLQNDDLISLYIYDKIYTSSSEVSDDASYTIAYYVVYVEIAFEIREPVNSDVIDYMLAIQDTFIDTGNPSRNRSGVKYEVEIDVYDVSNVGARQLFDQTAGELSLILKHGKETEYPKTILSRWNYMCPLVRINSNEFNIIRLSHSIYIEEFNVTFDENEVLIENITEKKAFSVRMCTNIFKELMEPFTGTKEQLPRENDCNTEKASTNGIVSLVCSSISLIFSVLTLGVYLSFKELKTQPGINNIVLCSALIIAQALFQFGSGQSCNISKVACQIIGILVHFSWLFLIFWMNICCIHMFRVFRLISTRVVLFNTTKTTMIYILYSFSASLILVLINVIVSLNGSEGQDVGYGGSMCYISKGHMVAYLFALPVAIIVFMNSVLFIIIMLQTKNLPKVQNDKNERNLLQIYAKLSTLTGGTWIFGFFSFFLNVAVLDYIFIILNASQGMFLFFAFVANSRTLKLLMKKDQERTGNNRTNKDILYCNGRGVTGPTTV